MVRCRVAERRMYSCDLPRGGFEIPCVLVFKGKCKELEKLKRLLKTYVATNHGLIYMLN